MLSFVLNGSTHPTNLFLQKRLLWRVLLGDVSNSGDLTFMDIVPFIEVLQTVNSQIPPRPYLLVEATDINLDGKVNFLDIGPLIALFKLQ